MTSSPKLRLAVVGGGIGGLTLALAITRLEIDAFIQVDIYEAATRWEIIKELGLEDDLVEYMSPEQETTSKTSSKRSLIMKKGDQKETLSQSDVQTVLLKNISSATQIHLDKRLVAYGESDQAIELHFKNGETALCDILVGADGVHSVVRKGFLAKAHNLTEDEAEAQARPVWSGSIIYRSMIDSDLIRKQAPNHPCLTSFVAYLGKSKHVISYPISRGKLINVVAYSSEFDKEGTFVDGPAVTELATDDVSSLFKNWSEEVQYITKNVSRPLKWAVEVVRPLDKYADGHIFLLGDSAHAMTPHLGNGAGQAVEDAYIFAKVLNKALRQGKTVDISKIAEVYNAIRTPLGNFAAEASRIQGLRYELEVAGFEDVKEGDVVFKEKLLTLCEAIERGSKWIWETSIDDDVKRALEMI